MKLFEKEKIIKFFNILRNMNRIIPINENDRIYGHLCQKEIFVRRTINKWLTNKFLILYAESELAGIEYKRYISIYNIRYTLGYGESLSVYIHEPSRPDEVFNVITIDYNEAISLEGEWCIDGALHKKIADLFVLNLTEKEYVFEAFDYKKSPKRKKKNQKEGELLKQIETTVTVKARTEKEAYKLKRELEKNSELLIGRLIH